MAPAEVGGKPHKAGTSAHYCPPHHPPQLAPGGSDLHLGGTAPGRGRCHAPGRTRCHPQAAHHKGALRRFPLHHLQPHAGVFIPEEQALTESCGSCGPLVYGGPHGPEG